MNFIYQLDEVKEIVRKHKAGQIIIFPGEVPKRAFVLKSGQVKVYTISSNGTEQLVTFHMAGEFFPSSWIFKKSVSSQFFYETMTDSEIIEIDRDRLLDEFYKTPHSTSKLIDYLSTYLAASLMRINALQQPTAREKIVYSLYYLCQRYNYEASSPKNIITIPIQLTHQQIAAFIGLTRETTAYEMSKLKKTRVLTYNSKSYKVDMAKLLEIIGEDSFKDISISY